MIKRSRIAIFSLRSFAVIFAPLSNYTTNVSYTLPSSSTTGFISTTIKNMYNGPYSPGDASSYGSHYNGRVANALEGTEAFSAGNITKSICPKAWHVPTNSQQVIIVSSYRPSYNIVLAGYYRNSYNPDAGSVGYWWSSTAYDSTQFYAMQDDRGSMYTFKISNYPGMSLRCLAK